MRVQFDGSGVDPSKLYSLSSTAVALASELLAKSSNHENPESFLRVPEDASISKELEKVVKSFKTDSLRYVISIGIGGSSFSANAICDFFNSYKNKYGGFLSPQAFFLENVDQSKINLLNLRFQREGITADQVIFLLISKSGTTFEVERNLEKLETSSYLSTLLKNRLIVIGKAQNPLLARVTDYAPFSLELPDKISGRLEALSSVGLLAPALLNVNVSDIRKGATGVNDLLKDFTSYIFAETAVRFHYIQKSYLKDVIFCFDERLESLGKWMDSIISESLGKRGKGIMPVVAVGSRDMHALGQLLFGGSRDVFTYFLYTSHTDEDNIRAMRAVQKAYSQNHMPYLSIELFEETIEESLGTFIQSRMIETVLLAGLMGVNPYDQPNVELYKSFLK